MRLLGNGWRCFREDLLVAAATGLFAAGLCFIKPTLLESVDYVLFYEANFHFLADAVREWRAPLWNPYIALGRPYLADTQNAAFYPPIYLVCLGLKAGVFLLVWLHCVLAVFGMRRLAGALRTGRWQGYFAAFSYLASGPLLARWVTGEMLYCCALCYVPGLFYHALRSDARWQSRQIALHALLLALQFLCGHPQVFWFTAIGQAVFIVSRALGFPIRRAFLDAGRGLCHFAVACLWCVGLVAVGLLPFLELARYGNRVGASPAYVNSYKLEWEHLGSLISPLGLVEGQLWINWEMNLFVGPIVLVLGLAGMCRVREREVRGLLAVLIVGLLLALGNSTPLFALFYKGLPGFASFRIHAREGLLVTLTLICAAAIWLSRPHPWLRAVWALNFNVPVRHVLIGLVLLQGLGLVYAAWVIKRMYTFSVVFQYSPDYPFQRTLVTQLRQAGLMEPAQPPPRVCVPWACVPANRAMIYQYSSFDAYTSLFLQRPWDYLHQVLGVQPPQVINTSVSEEVYKHGPFPYPDLAIVAGVAQGTEVLQVATNAAPRAFLVYAAEVVGDYGTILTRLAKGHDIHRSALLEKPLAAPLPRASPMSGAPARIRRFEPDALWVEVEAKQPALLVLAEAWYPGWRALVDGRGYDCLPANVWMRAVPVPAGRHQVRFYFHQQYLLPGALISLVSFGLILLAILAKPEFGASLWNTLSRSSTKTPGCW